MSTILHVSDIHFGPPHRPVVGAGLMRLVEARRPDVLVVSGDLTQRAKAYQFRQAREYLDAMPVPWIAVPGNHDVPMYRVWERAFAPFWIWRKSFGEIIEPELLVGDLAIVGLNSAHNLTIKHGRLRRAQVDRACERLAALSAGATRIVVTHHPVVRVPGYDRDPATRGSSYALERLAAAGVELILSGHLHQLHRTTTEEQWPQVDPPILLLQSGTTTSSRGRNHEEGRCSGWWIEVEETAFALESLMWSDDEGEFLTAERFVHGRSTH